MASATPLWAPMVVVVVAEAPPNGAAALARAWLALAAGTLVVAVRVVGVQVRMVWVALGKTAAIGAVVVAAVAAAKATWLEFDPE
jgi:hypothetical protein